MIKLFRMSFRTPCAMLGHVVSQVLRGFHVDETLELIREPIEMFEFSNAVSA